MLASLALRFLVDFTLYDGARVLFGVRSGFTRLGPVGVRSRAGGDWQDEVRSALRVALAIYPRQVKCLQRAVVLARVLRERGLRAELVIGYCSQPFIGHAWVEIDGQVVDGPSTYARRMMTLERISDFG